MHRKFAFRSNVIILLVLSFLCLFYFTWIQQYIPHIFLSDSISIRNMLSNFVSFTLGGNSYINTASFFRLLGFHYFTPIIYIQLFSWCVFNLFLLTVLRIKKNTYLSKKQIVSLIFFSIIYGFYFANYSKDLIVILFLLIGLNLYLFRKNLFYIFLFITLYGFLFRSYWLIESFALIFIFLQKRPKIKKNLILIIIFFLIIIFLFDVIKHTQITDIRLTSRNSNANSLIRNLIPNSSYFSDCINYLYVVMSFFIPIQGLPSSNMILYYLWIWVLVYISIKYNKYINKKLLLMLVCYLSIQALFEPDFGSVFRHQLSFFPIIFYLYNNNSLKYNIN